MLEPGVGSARINKVGNPELPDPSQPLKKGMRDQIKKQFGRYSNESVYRIIYYLSLIGILLIQKLLCKVTCGLSGKAKITKFCETVLAGPGQIC
jgi:hypothetical protein